MLSEKEKREIEHELAHSEQPRAAAPEVLKIIQKHRGWVSDEAVADAAATLGMTAEEVDSLATMYNTIYRRGVGRHVILLCDSVSCCVAGYKGILEHFSKSVGVSLGQTTDDGRFTLLPVACLGACEQAPAMMVDDDMHGNLTPQKIDEILAAYK